MNKCFKCGTEFEGSFCPNCGAMCEETKTCLKCGAQLDGQVKFCNHCGHSFVEKQKPKKNVGEAIKNAAKKSKVWLIAHKSLAIFVCIILLLGIALTVILPLTVFNFFRANKVAKINIGDDYAQVEKILGEPYRTDSRDYRYNSSDYIYNYYSNNLLKKLKQLAKLEAKQENIDSFDDLVSQTDKENKLQEQIDALEHKYIRIYFDNEGKVTSVEFDKHAQNNNTDISKEVKDIQLIPDKIPYGMTPQETELYAKIFYTDGSYRLNRVRGMNVESDKSNGWTINWSDNWGEYTATIKNITSDTECPDFTLQIYGQNSSGNFKLLEETFTLSEQLRSVVVIYFWATWCGPCVVELPYFNTVANEYHDVKVVAIHGSSTEDVARFITISTNTKDSWRDYKVIFLQDELKGELCNTFQKLGGNSSWPMTVIVGKDGKITFTKQGSLSYDKLKEEVTKAINAS